jgi:hypothetical protein
MGGGSGGSGSGGRSGGGGSTNGDAGQPGEVVREANKANDAAQFRYEMDQMESGTRYANRNVPGATMLSEREIRDLERMGKPERVKSKQERTRERQREAAREAAKNPDKASWKFPSNPKKGDTVVNGYGAKREWTGTFWR